jgi:hypothetical protein
MKANLFIFVFVAYVFISVKSKNPLPHVLSFESGMIQLGTIGRQ